MKPIKIYVPFLKFFGILGFAFFPFIFIQKGMSDSENKRIINHETIHIHQMVEFLIFPFILLYIIEFTINMFRYSLNVDMSYRNISFEKEAYSNDQDLDYLKKRKSYSSLDYL